MEFYDYVYINCPIKLAYVSHYIRGVLKADTLHYKRVFSNVTLVVLSTCLQT